MYQSMIEHIRIIIAFGVFFVLSYFLKLFFIDVPKAKVNSMISTKEFTQEEIDKNNQFKKEYYDNLQKKHNKQKIKYDRIVTKKQDSFGDFRKLLD